MKTGRKPKLNQIKKEFIWANHRLGSTYLGKLFDVSPCTIRRVKVEKDLQDKRYLKKSNPKKPKIKTMKRPVKLNESQKKFIKEHPRFTNIFLAELFNVGATQILEYRRKLTGIKQTNYRRKSDGYDNLIGFAREKGYRNITEAIDGFGDRETLMKEYRKQSA